jgi:hypothetical protein
MREDVTLQASGTVGISQAIGTDIAVITNPGPGRWKVWGTARHTLADGCRLLIGATTLLATISSAATEAAPFGPVVVDVLNATDDFILELSLATGGSDTASGTLYAQKLNQ